MSVTERRWTLWFTSEGERDENRSAMVSGPHLTLAETDGRGVEVVPVEQLRGAVEALAEIKRAVTAWQNDEHFEGQGDWAFESDAHFLEYIADLAGGR